MSGATKQKQRPHAGGLDGLSLDQVLAGVRGAVRGMTGPNAGLDLRAWRDADVGAFTDECWSVWAEDAHELLVPSLVPLSVKNLRIATTKLRKAMGWSSCTLTPNGGSGAVFPAGALAMLEWERGNKVKDLKNAVCIYAGLPPDLMQLYWDLHSLADESNGMTRERVAQIYAAVQEGGEA
jgi:hypothetical protein